jgi:hypothetical protein
MANRPPKITFAEMRERGARRIPVYSTDHHLSQSVAINAHRCRMMCGPSDLEGQFVCPSCGKRGADVQPDWQSGAR